MDDKEWQYLERVVPIKLQAGRPATSEQARSSRVSLIMVKSAGLVLDEQMVTQVVLCY